MSDMRGDVLHFLTTPERTLPHGILVGGFVPGLAGVVSRSHAWTLPTGAWLRIRSQTSHPTRIRGVGDSGRSGNHS